MKLSLILCSDMHMDLDKANTLINSKPGCEWVTDYTEANVIFIMTCAFGTKRHYSMQVIADVMINAKPGTRIIATGCLVKTNKAELEAIPNLEVKSFDEVLKMYNYKEKNIVNERKIHTNSIIISNGCLKKCSYCLYGIMEEKYTSKPMEDILSEVEQMQKTESVIYITGAHETSDYGVDLYGKRSFAELLNKICTKFPNCKYVIGWFHPNGLTDDVIEIIAKNKNIIQIMLHIQHNDNQILKNMNRPRFKTVEKKIKKLREARPDISISTELIVGFPGETDEKFEKLVKYLDENRDMFQDIGVASYEPVLNTMAARLDNLPMPSVRDKRMRIIEEKFNATCYPAPEDFKPLLSSFFEAHYMLSRIPKICITANERQVYQYIAGTDTEYKMILLKCIPVYINEICKQIEEEEYKYTPEFKNWIMQIKQKLQN